MSYLDKLRDFQFRSTQYKLWEKVDEIEALIDNYGFDQLTRKKFEGVSVVIYERGKEKSKDIEDLLATELIGMCLAVDNKEAQIRRVFNAIQALDERVRQKKETSERNKVTEVTIGQIKKEIDRLIKEAEEVGVDATELLKRLQINILQWQTSGEIKEEIEGSLLQIRSVVAYSSDRLKGIAKPLLIHSIDSVLKSNEQIINVFPDFVEFISQTYAYFSDAAGRETGGGG